MTRARLMGVLWSALGFLGGCVTIVDLAVSGMSERLWAISTAAILSLICAWIPAVRSRSGQGSAESLPVVQVFGIFSMAWVVWAYWPELDVLQANAASDAFRVEEAVALYSKAISSERLPTARLSAAYQARGDARYSYEVHHGIRDAEMISVLEDYLKARKLKESMDVHEDIGFAYLALGAYPEALHAFREMAKFDLPELHWSLLNTARVHRIVGEYSDALTDLDKVLKIWGEGTGMAIYYNRGRLFFEMGDMEKAIDAFSKGIPRQAEFPWALTYRGCAYARLGHYDKAAADLRLAIARIPAWAPARTPGNDANMKETADDLALVERLRAGDAELASAKSLCGVGWNWGERRRERSPLLPRAAP